MINNALFCVCFLSSFFVLLIFLFFFSFLFFCLRGEGGICVVFMCLFCSVSMLSILTFIYKKYKLSIIHYFLYYLFLQRNVLEIGAWYLASRKKKMFSFGQNGD
jgi:hypothetical protein